MNNLVSSTAHELAAGIRRKQLSAVEALEAHLAQIARHNPALNAVVTVDEKRARARAGEADRALYWQAGLAYTSPFNLTGHPAIVLPLARSAEGLPIGIQVVGRRWGDMQLLAIAKRLAEVIGPFQGPAGY